MSRKIVGGLAVATVLLSVLSVGKEAHGQYCQVVNGQLVCSPSAPQRIIQRFPLGSELQLRGQTRSATFRLHAGQRPRYVQRFLRPRYARW